MYYNREFMDEIFRRRGDAETSSHAETQGHHSGSKSEPYDLHANSIEQINICLLLFNDRKEM